MSNDHQDTRGFHTPTTVEQLHRQTPSTTGDNLPNSFPTTPLLPHTPSPMSPEIETTAPHSPVSAALRHATTTTTVNTHNPLPQTPTNTTTNSSENQDSSHFNEELLHRKNNTPPPPPPRVSSTPKSTTSPPESSSPSQAVVERACNGCYRLQLSCSCGKRQRVCRDVAFFLNFMLILFFFFMIGFSYSFLLLLSILFT